MGRVQMILKDKDAYLDSPPPGRQRGTAHLTEPGHRFTCPKGPGRTRQILAYCYGWWDHRQLLLGRTLKWRLNYILSRRISDDNATHTGGLLLCHRLGGLRGRLLRHILDNGRSEVTRLACELCSARSLVRLLGLPLNCVLITKIDHQAIGRVQPTYQGLKKHSLT